MTSRFTSIADEEFGDSYIDISKTEKRLIRVTTKTYESTGTYLFLKLFKKQSDGEFYMDQRITLTVKEFQALIDNSENINLVPQPAKEEENGLFKRSQKQSVGGGVPRTSKFSTSGTI